MDRAALTNRVTRAVAYNSPGTLRAEGFAFSPLDQEIRTLAISISAALLATMLPIPYLDKVFTKPRFVCQEGICDIELVAKTITEHISPRIEQLLTPGTVNLFSSIFDASAFK